jgi:hypothetical protein
MCLAVALTCNPPASDALPFQELVTHRLHTSGWHLWNMQYIVTQTALIQRASIACSAVLLGALTICSSLGTGSQAVRQSSLSCATQTRVFSQVELTTARSTRYAGVIALPCSASLYRRAGIAHMRP